MRLVAEIILTEACARLGIDLPSLVAATSMWAHPETFRALANDGGCWYPNTRRFRAGSGEQKRQVIDGVRLDDNTYANYAIKRATGFRNEDLEGFAVCHVWPGTTYDHRCHTCIANLVLVPAPLGGLTDHHQGVEDSMKYRAHELYGWHPPETDPPVRPQDYPTSWRDPMPCNENVRRFLQNRRRRA